MIEIHNFSQLSTIEKQIVAGMVSASTLPVEHIADEHSLAPASAEEIMASELALVGFVEDSFAGYIRAKTRIDDLGRDKVFRQVGSLFVPSQHRSQGVAHALVSNITDLVTDQQQIPYAFCGPNSLPRFEKIGYRIALPGELPSEAVSVRGNQAVILGS